MDHPASHPAPSSHTAPAVGLVVDDRYLQHDPGLELHWDTNVRYPFVDPIPYASNYHLVFRSKHLIDGRDLVRLDAYPATDEQIAYCHLPAYIDLVRETAAAGGGDRRTRHAGGRLVVLQGGGYSEIYGPYCTVAIVETLTGRRVGRSEPLGPEHSLTRPETTTVVPSGEAALDRIAAAHAPYWPSLAGHAPAAT